MDKSVPGPWPDLSRFAKRAAGSRYLRWLYQIVDGSFMTHDPTTNDSDPVKHMAFPPQGTSVADSRGQRPSRRRVNLSDADAALVDKTRSQIRELVQEVHQLANEAATEDEFYEGFLTRIVTALASVGGAIWTHDPRSKSIDLKNHINLKQTSLNENPVAQETHSNLIRKVCDRNEATTIPPDTASTSSNQAGNPTDFLLVIAPIKVDGETVGLVEIFQRPGAGPSTQRGYLRFLLQMCEVASEFQANLRMRSYQQKERMWGQLEKFVHLIHRKLDVNEAVYAIANEGRRLIECDRVSVGLMQGRRCQIKVVSGLDAIERRSEQVKTLNRLVTAVVQGKKPLWYEGDTENLPPRIEKRIRDHVEKSHARMVAVIPLVDSAEQRLDEDLFRESKPRAQEKPVGALVIEQLNECSVAADVKDRIELVASHAQTSLVNSIDHQSIFLMPLWRMIGKSLRQFHGDRLFRTTSVAIVVAALISFLCLFPWPFTLGANGTLVPSQQREIYAQLDGLLTEINVSNTGDTVVGEGDVLATMVSSALDMKIGDIEGQIAQAKNERRIAEAGKTSGDDVDQRETYAFQYARADQKIANLQNELNVQLRDRELLKVRAPIDGRVVNWQARQNLIRRPVRYGQHLMTIVPEDTQWLIELEMPERKLAHLTRAMDKSAGDFVKVSIALVSLPGKEFEGELLSVDQKLDVYSDEGNAALVRVRFPNDEVPAELLRSGTRVTGKVDCGTQSIGYALFYELIETVQSKWQFWF